MTPSELLELAGIVYPDDHWEINGNEVIARDIVRGKLKEIYKFAPSLKSEGRPAKQALDVIVAASRLKYFSMLTWEDGFTVEYLDPLNNERSTLKCPDILTASAKALIASMGKA